MSSPDKITRAKRRYFYVPCLLTNLQYATYLTENRYYQWLAYGMRILFPQMTNIHSFNFPLAYSWCSKKYKVGFFSHHQCALLLYSLQFQELPAFLGPISSFVVSGMSSNMLLPPFNVFKAHIQNIHKFSH